MTKPKRQDLEFEDVLSVVGDYGKYQKLIVFLFMSPTSILVPFIAISTIFFLYVPDHWCYNPDLANANLSSSDLALLQRPLELSADGDLVPSKCSMYAINKTILENTNISTILAMIKNNSLSWSKEPCIHGWKYDTTNYKETAASRFNLVCQNDYLPTLVFTLCSVGSTIGTPIFGALSDKFGRKPIFFVCVAIAALTKLLNVIPIFEVFAATQTLNGLIMPAVLQIRYLIVFEIVSTNVRTRINGINHITWTIGSSLLPLVAFLTADWILLGWVCFALILPQFLYYRMIPESPRWLMTRGRFDDASDVLLKIADTNEKDTMGLNLSDTLKKMTLKESTHHVSVSLWEIFKYPRLVVRLLIICFILTTTTMAYTGFYLNVYNLNGNAFLNFFLLALVELPSLFCGLYLMETRFGRRWSSFVFLLVASFGCFLLIILPSDVPNRTIISSLIGKFGTSAVNLVIYQHTPEIFPTVIRASALAVASSVASLFNITSPYIVYLGHFGIYIPYTIFCCLCVAAAILSIFLPETLNENLLQTLEDGENFGRDKQCCSLATRKYRESINQLTTDQS